METRLEKEFQCYRCEVRGELDITLSEYPHDIDEEDTEIYCPFCGSPLLNEDEVKMFIFDDDQENYE